MLHQILFCLLGKTGSIVKQSESNDRFIVDPSLNMFTNAEICLIQQIAKVGYQYKILHDFVIKEIVYLDQNNTNFLIGQEPSVYRKALASGIKGVLQGYSQKIVGIQNNYLKNKHFTISYVRTQISTYEILFKVLNDLTSRIKSKRGGIIVDMLQAEIYNNSIKVQDELKKILAECCKVFLNQISAWILYGKIIDIGGEFFVHRVTTENFKQNKLPNRNQIQITDWDSYILQISMVPRSLIQAQTAQKILFIGKGVKILRSLERGSGLPRKDLQEKVKQLSNQQFNSSHFDAIIEQLRLIVAQEMIDIIMGQEKLMKELQKVNGYYLMRKGDFYHLFIEECKGIENIISKEKAQKKINEKYLQNVFMRLDSFQDAKIITFELKQLGFIYLGFRHISNLCLVGNLHLIDSKNMRFNGIGSLWHKTKQLVQTDFNMVFSFSFKKAAHKLIDKKAVDTTKKSTFNFVIHNTKDPNSRVYDAPINFHQIKQYICVRFGVQENQKLNQLKSFVHIVTFDAKKSYKQQLQGQLLFSQSRHINFLDQKPQKIHVKYQKSLLTVQIKKEGFKEGYSIKSNILISNYVNLEMGRASVGFIPQLSESNLAIELENWEMACKTANNPGNNWSDLCLNYKLNWPINLIITSDLQESFLRINKFLLPIRKTQIELQTLWVRIPRRSKGLKDLFARKLERKLSMFRWQLSLVLNQLWSYFQSDVIETTWLKLKQAMTKVDDFQQLRAMVNKYVKSIGTMFFFNIPKIQGFINKIMEFCKTFINLFNQFERVDINEEHQYTVDDLSDRFKTQIQNFQQELKKWSQINSSNFLFHLIQRINCFNFSKDEQQIKMVSF